ncbi:hypothetical protein ABLT44_12890, partial [Acinetobacter johnsonii]|uniref:hypothetical protein n=1 Tax=Acinetobacter johnsonii TaxID=40214 RepID=UPI0032B4FBC4
SLILNPPPLNAEGDFFMRHLLKQKTEELRTCIYKGLNGKKPAFSDFYVLYLQEVIEHLLSFLDVL